MAVPASTNPAAPIFGSSTVASQNGNTAYAPSVGDANPIAAMASDLHNAYETAASSYTVTWPNQTIVYGIDPAARSRLNAVLFVGIFTGMACGAWLGSLALAQWGWMGVVGLATAAASAALVVRTRPARD